MNTEIFKSYTEFVNRPDEATNGVSLEFVKKYPDYERGNQQTYGCWNCYICPECYRLGDFVNCTNTVCEHTKVSRLVAYKPGAVKTRKKIVHEIRGRISIQGAYSKLGTPQRCACEVPHLQHFYIGDKVLYDYIESILPQDNVVIMSQDDYDPEYTIMYPGIPAGYRFYVVDDTVKHPEKITLDDLDENQMIQCLGGEVQWLFACYSAATCGLGEWNNGVFGGHNIYDELAPYVGKYVIIEFQIGGH